jgi:hypothetical protein
MDELIWMHAPRELERRELVPGTEVVNRQAQGWMHCDPPPDEDVDDDDPADDDGAAGEDERLADAAARQLRPKRQRAPRKPKQKPEANQ